MRYLPAHAAASGLVPFTLRGSKPLRMAMATATAGLIGLVPAVLVTSPASAASLVLTVVPTPATEGNAVSFTLAYSGNVAATYLISTQLTGGATASSTDFNATPSSTSVNFQVGGSPQVVTVATVDDALYEANETFILHVENNANTSDFVDAVGTINNNDAIPSYTLTASPPTVTEALNAKSTITATLSAVSGMAVPITLNTVNGSAVAPGDYTALTNVAINIPAGQLTASTDVSIAVDNLRDELSTETFTVNGVASNVSPTTSAVTVGIADAQSDPVITLTGGGNVTEGNSVTYTVGILPSSERPVTVSWDAVAAAPVSGHGTATPGTDFTYATLRTVTIPPGMSSAQFSIPATVDVLDELPEDFGVQLSNPTNATLGSSVKIDSSITDTNSAPTVAITPIAVIEGDSGKSARTFTATLSEASGREVNVSWASALAPNAPGINYATAVKDFTIKSGTLTFPAGNTMQTFTVEIAGDTVDEGNGEEFAIRLSNMDGSASITNNGGTLITITDDDSAPTLTFGDVTVKEGESGSAVLMPVMLNGSSNQNLTFTAVTAIDSGTAAAGGSQVGENDYDLLTSDFTIAAESTVGYVVVLVNGDYVYEMDETANFTVSASSGSDIYVTDPDALTAKLTIENDDMAPDLEINSITGAEGDTVEVTGRVTGISATDTMVTVQFAGGSSNGSVAASTNDFTNPGARQIQIDAGTTPGTDLPVASVMLTSDDAAEPAETIIATGFGLGNVGTVTEGIVTIAASDGGTDPTDPTGPDAVTLNGPPHRILAGTVKLIGTTDVSTEVELWSAPYNGGPDSWVSGGTVTSGDEDGVFVFNPTLTTTGRKFVARVSETVVSDEVLVRMRQAPTLAGSSTTVGVAALRAGGGIPRTPFIMQRWNGRGWDALFTGNLMSNGTYYKALPGQPSKRSIAYRLYVYGSTAHGVDSAYSTIRYVQVR